MGGERNVEVVLAEIRELERFLAEMPPHGGDSRADVHDHLDRLRRELARLRVADAEG